jgi:hypothetical protein
LYTKQRLARYGIFPAGGNLADEMSLNTFYTIPGGTRERNTPGKRINRILRIMGWWMRYMASEWRPRKPNVLPGISGITMFHLRTPPG